MPSFRDILMHGTDGAARIAVQERVDQNRRAMGWGASDRQVDDPWGVNRLLTRGNRNKKNGDEVSGERTPNLIAAVGQALIVKGLTHSIEVRGHKIGADPLQQRIYDMIASIQDRVGDRGKLLLPTEESVEAEVDRWESEYAAAFPYDMTLANPRTWANKVATEADKMVGKSMSGRVWGGPITSEEKMIARNLLLKRDASEEEVKSDLRGQLILRAGDLAESSLRAKAAEGIGGLAERAQALMAQKSDNQIVTDLLTAETLLSQKEVGFLLRQTWQIGPGGITIFNPSLRTGEVRNIPWQAIIFPDEKNPEGASVRISIDLPGFAAVISGAGGGLFKRWSKSLTQVGGILRFESIMEGSSGGLLGMIAVRHPREVAKQLGRMKRLNMTMNNALKQVEGLTQGAEPDTRQMLRYQVIWSEYERLCKEQDTAETNRRQMRKMRLEQAEEKAVALLKSNTLNPEERKAAEKGLHVIRMELDPKAEREREAKRMQEQRREARLREIAERKVVADAENVRKLRQLIIDREEMAAQAEELQRSSASGDKALARRLMEKVSEADETIQKFKQLTSGN